MRPFQKAFAWRILNRGIKDTPVHRLKTNDSYGTPIEFRRKNSTNINQSGLWPIDFIPSCLELKSHPLGWKTFQRRVEPYIEQNWPFADDKKKKAFFALGISRALSEWFPLTLDDRITLTGKMNYLLVLIDDELDKMEMSGLLHYRERIIGIARGEAYPMGDSCLEHMLHDTLGSMRSINENLTNDLVEGLCTLIQGQTAANRLTVKSLGSYLEYREVDVGISFYPALIRFGADLHLTPAELEQVAPLESHAFRFFGAFNDIYSWEKEWKAFQEHKTDGAYPFSAIYILAQETGLSYSACKRMMLVYCRELELAFKECEEKIRQQNLRSDMIKYITSLEYFMSGVESWTKWTPRYQV